MKSNALTLVLILFFIIPYGIRMGVSQTYKARYMQVTRLGKMPDSVTATMVFNSNTSNYQYTLANHANANQQGQVKEFSYHRDLKAGKMLNREYLFDAAVLLSDTVPEIQWEIAPEAPSRVISKLTCRKATGSFRGRVYVVWFSEQYPVKAGPWKLAGLPGLIVEAEDTLAAVKYTLMSIETTNAQVLVPTAPTSMSQTQYVQSIKKKLNGLDYSMSAEDAEISITSSASVRLNVLEKFLF
jgi:GLPGLI family protein